MATPLSSPKHDLGSLRIHEAERKGGRLGKGLAIFFGGLVILGGISGAVFALWKPKPVVEVTTVHKPAGAGGREALLNASGYVTPRRRATIAAKITGRVTGVFFDEGTRVAEGQLLAPLADSDVRRVRETARADRDSSEAAIGGYEIQLRNAEITVKRAQQLKDAGVQTQEALDNARTSAD